MDAEGASDIDDRSSLFVGLTPANLAAITATWPRTDASPPGVASLLGESRRLFVGGSQSYDNFANAVLKGLQAADLGLKLRLGLPSDDKRTLGTLIKYERETCEVLSDFRRGWYTEFALRYRNWLSYPEESVAFTPGMSSDMVRSVHETIAELFPDPWLRHTDSVSPQR